MIARAAAILRALEDENAGLSLGQIAQRVNLARSTVQRIVAALETEKLVIAATPNGRVRLGPTILRLAASVRSDFVVAGAAVPGTAVGRTARDRRSLDGEEGSSGVHRPGDRLAAPAHRVGGRRDFSAPLHRQRQGLSGATVRSRHRSADRPHLRSTHAEVTDRVSMPCSPTSRSCAAPASPMTARSTRSASAPPASRCRTRSAIRSPSRCRCRASASRTGRR